MVYVNTNDLKHILDQILIAEQHAAGTPLTDLVLNPLLPYGLRLVDGTMNNLTEGRETWGSADQVMPRYLNSTFLTQPAEAHLADPNPRAPQAGPTSYLQTSGSVYDADPRIISNLVADQTLANPAAIAAVLAHNGMTGQAMLTVANEISTAYRAVRDAQAATTNVDAAIALQRAALQAAVTSAQQAYNTAVADVSSMTTVSAAADQAVSDAQATLADASAALVALQNAGDLGAAQAALEQAQAALVTAQEGLTAAQTNLTAAEGVAAAALAARDAAQAEVTRLEGESVAASDALSSAQVILSDAQATLSGLTVPTGLEDAQAAVTTAEGLVASAQAAVDDVAARLATAQTQLADLNTQLATAEASVATAQSQLTTAQQAATETQTALEAAQATYDAEVLESASAQSAFMAAFSLYLANPATNFAQMSAAAALWSAARAELDAADAALTRATTADAAADIAAASAQTILTTAQGLVTSLTAQRDTVSGTITRLNAEQTTAAETLTAAQTDLATAQADLAVAELDSAAYLAAQTAVETAQAAVNLAQSAADAAAGAVTSVQTELTGLETALIEADAEVTRLSGIVGTAEADVTTATDNVTTAQGELAAAQAASTDMIAAMATVANATLAVQSAIVAAELASGDLTAALASEALAQTALATATADLAAADSPDAAAAATAAAEAAVVTAQTALDTLLTTHGVAMDGNNVLLPDVSPDEGLSAPYNSWMTLFGQFFDHGLDLVGKGGSGTVYIPLQPDDPLYVEGSPTNFMVLTRATNQPGPDGILGTADDVREHFNKTTPWVDQNQTYTSHPSHQVFLREYALDANGVPMATGHLLDGAGGGMSTWGDVKAQARDILGINLSDADVLDGPLLATDPYGNFIPGPNGLPQLVVPNPDFGVVDGAPEHILVEGNLANPVDTAQAVRNGHAFLEDIAHTATPGTYVVDRFTGETAVKTPDADTETGNAIIPNQFGQNATYDNELLDRHYIAGDGRGNENFGLTAVHHVFHSEHNRQVDEMKQTILASGELAFINEWLVAPITEGDLATATPAALSWDGERLFQAAKFATEMQYQHLAFEEFGRRVQPQIAGFVANGSADIDGSILAEFAHVVYRFGHSMLTENVHTMDPNGVNTSTDLITAFLNPVAFDQDGALTSDQAAGAVARGMSREIGSNIDEFITSALRDNLVGLPLDLAALNIARGRDTGVPSLNAAREQFFAATGNEWLRPYDNWLDYAANLKNPASIVNFIASYGTHETVVNAVTVDDKRAAATAIVLGGEGAPADRLDYVNGTGAWTGVETGINNVEFWIGGLAEAIMPFGGMLGSSFGFVFQHQMEVLQNGDRFYYLARTAGMNMLAELENNSFASIILRNTDLQDGGAHIPADIFSSMEYILEVDQSVQAIADPTSENVDPFLAGMGTPLVQRATATVDAALVEGAREYDNLLQFNGGEHVVLGGTAQRDILVGGLGDDALWGGAGNDLLIGGSGVNTLRGGAGDDIIRDGDDVSFLHGEDGNDVISAGGGIAELMFGGAGNDAILMGTDDAAEAFGGEGNDFIYGGPGAEVMFGGEGDDWIEGGDGFDMLMGDNGDPFGGSRVIGHDVLNGGANDNDLLGESGDDILIQGEGVHVNDADLGHDWIAHKNALVGADVDLTRRLELPGLDVIRDRYINAEAVSGTAHADLIYGDNRIGADLPAGADPLINEATFFGNELTQAGVDRIEGLRELLGDLMGTDALQTFTGGNILLGGGGSDVIQGRGGDDVIDGDRFLNVRISVRDPNDPTVQLQTVNSLIEIADQLLDGSINPGQLQIVREILDGGQEGDTDTAVYFDVRANYNVRANDDGSVTVEHIAVPAQADLGIDANNGQPNPEIGDGRDTLWNVEVLRFADMEIDLRTDPASNGVFIGTAAADVIDGTNGPDVILAGAGNDQINGLAGNDLIFAEAGSDTITWNAPNGGYDVVAGHGFVNDGGTDMLIVNGDGTETGFTMYTVAAWVDAGGAQPLDPLSEIIITRTANGVETAIMEIRGIEEIAINGVQGIETINAVGDFALTSLAPNTIFVNGTAGDEIIDFAGFLSTQRLVVDAGDGRDIITGGAGNDILMGGAGRDDITWSVGGGSDVVDGGADRDTFTANGDASDETFRVYAAGSWTGAPLEAGTDIVITRMVAGGEEAVIAQLANIEEIQINTGGGVNNVEVFGDFNPTSLAFNTITVNGTDGDDSIDISALTSAHRILFRSVGGNDTIVGTIREQDVIVLPEGTVLADVVRTEANGVVTLSDGQRSVSFVPAEPGVEPGIVVAGTAAESILVNVGTVNEAGVYQLPRGQIALTQTDVDALEYMITGQGTPPALPTEQGDVAADDEADFIIGSRDLLGMENNQVNPGFGAADQPYIRITEARYGEYDEATGNRQINPIFEGLDPRAISNTLGTQDADAAKAASANMFMMAFGQYFDHGLTFIPKGGNGTIEIGGPGMTMAPGSDNPADLTRATVVGYDENGVPLHENITSPFVDQNQVYGSSSLVGQLLRESDGNGGMGAQVLLGQPDPSNEGFRLMATLRELLDHHIQNRTVFTGTDMGDVTLLEYYPDLLDAEGNYNAATISDLVGNFMGETWPILIDKNPFMNPLDHFVGGDGRANENVGLTAMHTIWARNHNYHVELLEASGFEGTPEELFQAAKALNEAEYQQVVFNDFADALLGGLQGSGRHGHDKYDPSTDARISHEFAAAAYRFGHSQIGQTLTLLDAEGRPTDVPLFDAFLNPTNDPNAFGVDMNRDGTVDIMGAEAVGALAGMGYIPQPGYAQYGVNAILGGMVQQPSEQVDFQVVDAVRNDLVRISADLFAFNVARGWDVGLGTLNQVKSSLAASTNPYIREAIELSDLNMVPYASWEDFQSRNNLSDDVIARFQQAYPDLVLEGDAIAAFQMANPDITLVPGENGAMIVQGIDRVDLWVGGLAESHIQGGVVGHTFWVIIHEQLDRLQEGDRFYYTDRIGDLPVYNNFIGNVTLGDIVARNTGMTDLPLDIFSYTSGTVDDDVAPQQPLVDDVPMAEETVIETPVVEETSVVTEAPFTEEAPVAPEAPVTEEVTVVEEAPVAEEAPVVAEASVADEDMVLSGTNEADTLTGKSGNDVLNGMAGADMLNGADGDDMIFGGEGNDVLLAGAGDDIAYGDAGDDRIMGGAGRDMLFGGEGNDDILAGDGADMVYGEAGADRIFGNAGNDMLNGGAGNDEVHGGEGHDRFLATVDDGNDVYFGDEGSDTLDMSAILADANIRLGSAGSDRGAVMVGDSIDTIWSIENVIGGAGNDTIIASDAVNVMDGGEGNDTFVFESAAAADGDIIRGFNAGDVLCFSDLDADAGIEGNQSFTLAGRDMTIGAGQLTFSHDNADGEDVTIVTGDTGTDTFSVKISGHHDLQEESFLF